MTQNKVKGDKSIYQLIDKISIRYVNHISELGCQICAKKGKKTLNIEHILEALKEMNFHKHIKLLTSEPYLKEMENDEKEEQKYEDNMNVKQLINKKKKKNNKRNRSPENKEDLEELAREQKEMFELARLEQMQNSINYAEAQKNRLSNEMPNKSIMKIDDYEKQIFSQSKKEGQDEEDFDE